MADEKAAAKADEGAARGEAGAGGAAAKGPLIPPIMIRFSVIGGILVVMAVGAIFLVTDVIAPRLRKLGEPPAPAAEEAHAAPEAHHVATELVTITDLVVNPAGSGGRRYLKVAAGIEVTVEETKGKKKGKEKAEGGGTHGAAAGGAGTLQDARIRDLLIRELSARTLEELTDPTAKEEARQSIIAGLEEILGAGRIANVYFTEYVIQ